VEQTITSETAGEGVCLVMFNRPARRNALDNAMYALLGESLKAAEADQAVRVVVITGAGEHFTAGNDLADFLTLQGASSVPAIDCLRVLRGLSKPVLAAVEGNAIGVGSTMLLHCDLAYAAASARFRLPFVSLGLSPEGASTYLLPKVAGSKQAANLLLFGEFFSADQAAQFGLVNEVVPDGTALEHTLARAQILAKLPKEAVRLTKALLNEPDAAAASEALNREEQHFLACCASADAQAAFAAFLDKRR
jgi:enoyl-CoA hydratase/carnithine racemase